MLEREAAWFTAVLAFLPLYLWAWINCCFATVDRNMSDNSFSCATNDRFKPVIQHESPLGLLHCRRDIQRKCEQNLSPSKSDFSCYLHQTSFMFSLTEGFSGFSLCPEDLR